MKLPRRDDMAYIEIEQFKDYEVMQCIIYELAIRNKKVKSIINELDEINNYFYKNYAYNREYDKILKISEEKEENLYMDFNVYDYLFYKEKKYFEKEEKVINDLVENIEFSNALGLRDEAEVLELNNIFQKFKKLYKKIDTESKKNITFTIDLLYKHTHFPELIESFERFKELYYILENDYGISYLDIKRNKISKYNFINNRKYDNHKQVAMKKGITQRQEKIDNKIKTKYDIKLDNNNSTSIDLDILPEFSRPKITNKKYDKTISLNINLNTPKKEINNYFEELIKNYSLDSKSILTQEEIKEQKVIKKNNIFKKNKKIQENLNIELIEKYIQNNNKRGNKIQKKWADWFFTYDYWLYLKKYKNNLADYKIFDLIEIENKKYNDKDDIEKYWYSKDVYRKNIIPTMDNLINNLKYLDLLMFNYNSIKKHS